MDYSLIMIGSFLQALSYMLFPAPCKIMPGGVYGISIVIYYVTKDLFPFFPDGLPMGTTALCFNISLMILAIEKAGSSSGPKTIVAFLLTSIFTDSLSYFLTGPLMEDDTLIVVFHDGAILGLGVTCISRAQSTSVGTDVLARVIANSSNLKVSNMIIILGSAVVLLGLIALKDWAVPLYSRSTIFVCGKAVGMFQTESPNRAAFIVPRKIQELKTSVVDKMGMRSTSIHSKGMYQGNEAKIIFTIAERKDMPRLKGKVREVDPDAFVSTMHTSKDSPRPDI